MFTNSLVQPPQAPVPVPVDDGSSLLLQDDDVSMNDASYFVMSRVMDETMEPLTLFVDDVYDDDDDVDDDVAIGRAIITRTTCQASIHHVSPPTQGRSTVKIDTTAFVKETNKRKHLLPPLYYVDTDTTPPCRQGSFAFLEKDSGDDDDDCSFQPPIPTEIYIPTSVFRPKKKRKRSQPDEEVIVIENPVPNMSPRPQHEIEMESNVTTKSSTPMFFYEALGNLLDRMRQSERTRLQVMQRRHMMPLPPTESYGVAGLSYEESRRLLISRTQRALNEPLPF
jgi:hypothetical protein